MDSLTGNRYISDVPMRFTDRFLSRIVDESSLFQYTEVEDMNRFYVDDVSFSSFPLAFFVFDSLFL